MNNIHIYTPYECSTFDTLQSTQNRALKSVCFYECSTFDYQNVALLYLLKIIKTNTRTLQNE